MIEMRRDPEPMGIIPLHTSAVEIDGSALLFLGPSGAGKSTVRRLLGDVGRSLADDRVYLIPKESGEWEVVNAGKRILYGSLTVEEAKLLSGPPLRMVFRLYQATEPQLEQISPLEACRHLTAAFFDLYWHKHHPIQVKKRIFSRLAILAQAIPGYNLHFSRSSETVALVEQEVRIACPTSKMVSLSFAS